MQIVVFSVLIRFNFFFSEFVDALHYNDLVRFSVIRMRQKGSNPINIQLLHNE